MPTIAGSLPPHPVRYMGRRGYWKIPLPPQALYLAASCLAYTPGEWAELKDFQRQLKAGRQN